MHDQSIDEPPIESKSKRGQPAGSTNAKLSTPKASLPESINCAICGKSVKPKTRTQRFCSQSCYRQWWLIQVRPKATEAGINSIRKSVEDGTGPKRNERGVFIAETKRPRYRPHRKSPDPSILETVSVQSKDDNAGWAERAAYWEEVGQQPAPRQRTFGPDRPEPRPLVLNGHGIHLNIHQGALVVRNGFTHYPQENPETRFFPGDKKLPSRIVLLDSDGSISFDVIAWLAQHEVPLILLSWKGEVVSVVGDGQGPYDLKLREAQYAALTNGVGVRLGTELIRHKIEGCRETLLSFWKSPERDVALVRMQMALEDLDKGLDTVEEIRLIEARAALAYFTAWHVQPIKWKGIGRKPIPQDWHHCGTRQGLMGKTNRHAKHPVNAILNYAYAGLESRMRIGAITAGLDPTVGYMHAWRPGRLALVYDLMEPLRPKVDEMVLQFVREHTFSPSDFVVTVTGVCRLHPQLAREISGLTVMAEAVDKVVRRMALALIPDIGRSIRDILHIKGAGLE